MMQTNKIYFPSIESVQEAAKNLNGVASKTPLSKNNNLSKQFEANIFFKREDLQVVRSYKIRGAFNKMSSLSDDEKQQQIQNIEQFHQQHQAQTKQALQSLQNCAMERGNTFASLIEAVKHASLGQISHALYIAGGEYRRNM